MIQISTKVILTQVLSIQSGFFQKIKITISRLLLTQVFREEITEVQPAGNLIGLTELKESKVTKLVQNCTKFTSIFLVQNSRNCSIKKSRKYSLITTSRISIRRNRITNLKFSFQLREFQFYIPWKLRKVEETEKRKKLRRQRRERSTRN